MYRSNMDGFNYGIRRTCKLCDFCQKSKIKDHKINVYFCSLSTEETIDREYSSFPTRIRESIVNADGICDFFKSTIAEDENVAAILEKKESRIFRERKMPNE